MNKRDKLAELEELCQQRYSIIDSCYLTIQQAQKELQKLEVKYLKLKSQVEKLKDKPVRLSKVQKLRRKLLELGVSEESLSQMLKE